VILTAQKWNARKNQRLKMIAIVCPVNYFIFLDIYVSVANFWKHSSSLNEDQGSKQRINIPEKKIRTQFAT